MSPAPSLQSPAKPMERLTLREEAILRAIARLHFLTMLDIATLPACAGVSSSYLRKILAVLSGGKDTQPNQYLTRLPRPQTRRGSIEKVYTLGALGRAYLRKTLSEQVDWWHGPAKATAHSFSYLLHQLTLSRLVCAASSWAATQSQFTLAQDRLSYELARTAPTITREIDGQQITVAVVPDAWLLFARTDGEKFPILLEIDRGTEYQERFKKHVSARLHLILSGAYHRFFGVESVCIAYITTGITPEYRSIRLEWMRQWTKEVVRAEISEENQQAWMERFRFTSLEYETIYQCASALFTKNLWYQPDSLIPVALLSEYPKPQGEAHEHDDTPKCSETH